MDDVKQRKQKHFKQYRTAKQKLPNKENLVRFLHRGKPRKIHFCQFQIDIIQTSLSQKVSEKKIVSMQSYGRKKICGINFL